MASVPAVSPSASGIDRIYKLQDRVAKVKQTSEREKIDYKWLDSSYHNEEEERSIGFGGHSGPWSSRQSHQTCSEYLSIWDHRRCPADRLPITKTRHQSDRSGSQRMQNRQKLCSTQEINREGTRNQRINDNTGLGTISFKVSIFIASKAFHFGHI